MKTNAKISIKYYLIGALFLIIGYTVSAQSDSTMIEEETFELNENYYQRKYQYLDILLGDNINALKIAVQPFKPEHYINFGVLTFQFAYEQKINEAFSLLNEINSTSFWGDGEKVNELGYALGIRWYPLKSSEIKKGLSGNNNNGAYLGLKADNIFNAITIRDSAHENALDRHVQLNPTPEFSVGYQHKFSGILYIDTNLFINYSMNANTFGYGITLLIGTSFNIDN